MFGFWVALEERRTRLESRSIRFSGHHHNIGRDGFNAAQIQGTVHRRSYLCFAHQPLTPGQDGSLGSIGQVQFAQDVSHMTLDRVLTDHKPFFDL
jgi:hypothetical protein